MIKTIALAAASAIFMTSGALAEEYEKYGTVSGWTVWANISSGGCYIENRNNNGNTVIMGVRSNKADKAFFGVWNHANPIMKKGEKRDMKLDIDGSVYTFVAKANTGIVSEGLTGAYMYLNNPDFIADIENGNVMTVYTTDSTSFQIDLTGTNKGLASARECFAKLNS